MTAALYESSSDTATAYVTMAGLGEESFMDYFQEHFPVDHAVYMYAKYDVEPQLEGLDEITDEMIQNAIETKRAVYKELNSKLTHEIIGRYYDSNDILFVSSYAPVAIVETNQSDLTWLARRSDVQSVISCENFFDTITF